MNAPLPCGQRRILKNYSLKYFLKSSTRRAGESAYTASSRSTLTIAEREIPLSDDTALKPARNAVFAILSTARSGMESPSLLQTKMQSSPSLTLIFNTGEGISEEICIKRRAVISKERSRKPLLSISSDISVSTVCSRSERYSSASKNPSRLITSAVGAVSAPPYLWTCL